MLYISREIREEDCCSSNVEALLSEVKDAMRVAGKFNREEALEEAIREASMSQEKITNAKNLMCVYYPEKWKKILRIRINSVDLMKLMLDEFPLK